MKSLKKRSKNRRGIVFIIAMIFIAILASLSVSMVTMSSANAQLANNHKRGNRVMANAQSGAQIIRHMLEGMPVPATLASGMQVQLAVKGLTGINAVCTTDTITLSSVTLDSATESFNAVITVLADRWQADITGTSGSLSRTIRFNFNIIEQANTVFDFGVATKGPLLMSGQTEITGFNLAVESDIFIDTSAMGNSFEIGNKAMVEGKVHIVDPFATYQIGDNSEVGGETGSSAEDNIILGVDPVGFPTPNPEYFRQFATGDVIDSSTDLSSYTELNNVIIAANTNPTFSDNMEINGVLFVEHPNNVKFEGKADVQGIIAGTAPIGSDTTLNSFFFSGQVTCSDVSSLVGAEYDAIKNETGTFLIAPGSVVDFTGQSNLINGVIACSGARFTGQAGGTINGSIINYSSEPMIMQGQGSLSFNRSGTTNNPAGFEAVVVLDYDPDSYQEIRN
ncbi:MAG: hypothetical protein FVQ82_11190 [Planctomycetes bacterium]|nr:hypothetical protein [Planctomycetota bacterium]